MEFINVEVDDSINPSAPDVENVDLFSLLLKDKGETSVESGELSKSDTQNESSTDKIPVLYSRIR